MLKNTVSERRNCGNLLDLSMLRVWFTGACGTRASSAMVMLVNFDFGGKEKDPKGPLNFDLTIGRDGTDLRIAKGDDLRVLCRTLTYVQMK